jgi:hypothetical protein
MPRNGFLCLDTERSINNKITRIYPSPPLKIGAFNPVEYSTCRNCFVCERYPTSTVGIIAFLFLFPFFLYENRPIMNLNIQTGFYGGGIYCMEGPRP